MRYDASENPDPKAWLALDESKRIDLVIDFHRHNHLTLGGSDKLHGADKDAADRAIDNMCTHEQASQAEGEISGHEVTCPLHGAKFDVRTGEVLGPPPHDDVARSSVRVIGTDIEVDLE